MGSCTSGRLGCDGAEDVLLMQRPLEVARLLLKQQGKSDATSDVGGDLYGTSGFTLGSVAGFVRGDISAESAMAKSKAVHQIVDMKDWNNKGGRWGNQVVQVMHALTYAEIQKNG